MSSCHTMGPALKSPETSETHDASEPRYLNDVWTLYFHTPDDPDWTLSSYVRLTDVSTVEDFTGPRSPA